jgi:hypothetical protein
MLSSRILTVFDRPARNRRFWPLSIKPGCSLSHTADHEDHEIATVQRLFHLGCAAEGGTLHHSSGAVRTIDFVCGGH